MEYFDFSGNVVIEFYSEGCINCQMMTPIINNLEHSFHNIRFYRINADQRPDLVQKYRVTSIPSLLLFQNGRKITTIVGAKPEHILHKIILDALIIA